MSSQSELRRRCGLDHPCRPDMPQGSPKKIEVKFAAGRSGAPARPLAAAPAPVRPRPLQPPPGPPPAGRRCAVVPARAMPPDRPDEPCPDTHTKAGPAASAPAPPRQCSPGRHARHRGPLQRDRVLPVLWHQFLSSRNCPLFSVSHFWGPLQLIPLLFPGKYSGRASLSRSNPRFSPATAAE